MKYLFETETIFETNDRFKWHVWVERNASKEHTGILRLLERMIAIEKLLNLIQEISSYIYELNPPS